MPLRTSPIPPHSSASFYDQATPSLVRDDARWPHHDSSSSPGMGLATPTDAAKYHLTSRGRAPKEGQRRSVRVRTASGGRTSSSSPQVLLPDPPSSTTDYPAPADPPTRPRPSRTASNSSNPYSTSVSTAAQRARVGPPARSGAALNAATQASHAQTLALAQAHGITPDQFEEAKQQVMRFLRNDAAAAAAAAAEIPSSPSAQEKGKGKQILGRSSSSVSNGAGGYSSGAASMANVGSASAHLGSFLEQESSSRSLRTRASVESISHRNDEQSRKEQQLRRWAQEESSSSEEEGSTAAPPFSFSASSRHPSIPPSSAATTLLPSPSFGSDPQSSGLAPSPGTLKASLAKRGMMERFMSDRASPQKQQDDDEEPIASTSTLAQAPPQIRTVFSPGPSPRQPSKRELTASPPRRSAGSSPNPIMTSPAPSRGTGPGVLFSPDVAKLLRSELDEIEANEQSSRRKALSKKMIAEIDISVENHSSPFAAAEESPFISSNAKRTRDVFSADEGEGKRTRWANFFPVEEDRAVSPTPSAASISLRAPSFCDSSPAASDKASTAGGSRPPYLAQAAQAVHPASAPDFLYHGLPSSSPASSQHSAGSEYAPPRHRSSPGPSTAAHPSLQRSQSSTTSSAIERGTTRKQRDPLKRADTMPALVGPDGHQKPHWSYAALIGQAIFSTETLKMSLAEVYAYIMASYPYYKKEDSGWQNSIRHNLSLNECFVKTARGPDNPGKGCLWAIAAGCEDQFADGNFVKKGGQGNGRKPKGAKAAAAAAAAAASSGSEPSSSAPQVPPPVATRGIAKRGRDASPASSARAPSPAVSVASTASYRPSQAASAKAPSPSPAPTTALAAPPLTRTRSAPTKKRASPPKLAAQEPSSAPLQRRDSNVSNASTSRATIPPLPSPPMIHSPPAPVVEEQREEEQRVVKKAKLAEAYVHVPTSRASQKSPARSLQPAFDSRHALTSTVTASPPTSVYHRLAGPYQPISYSGSSTYNHRALALLASPEASGIMPVHPSDYDRGTIHQVPSHSASSSLDSSAGVSHFLPAPHIFPGSASRRERSDSEDKEEREPQSMLSPTAIVHTQSPISSIRGNPRAPMSPLQTSDEKLHSGFSSTSALADPEKKRATGLRHLPAVAAIADASFAADTFRSPPPSTSSRAHLRSPSGKSIGSAFQSALMSTPGARAGRAWGMSPGVGVMGADGAWGFGDSLEAELERFGAVGEQVNVSGGSSMGGPRLWQSPGMNHRAW